MAAGVAVEGYGDVVDGDAKGGNVVLPALVPNVGHAVFCAAGGAFPALGP
jgi:hypothetical protein